MFVLALAAAAATVAPPIDLPLQVTSIRELGVEDRLRHAEALQVQRDFGRPEVDVVLDVWMPADDPTRIAGLRLWWSDDVDRFPFSEQIRDNLDIVYRPSSSRPGLWYVTVAGDGKRFTFEVELHDGEPMVFTDVTLADGRLLRRCRAESGLLYARRVMGIPVGIQGMVVACMAADGTMYRAPVRTTPARR